MRLDNINSKQILTEGGVTCKICPVTGGNITRVTLVSWTNLCRKKMMQEIKATRLKLNQVRAGARMLRKLYCGGVCKGSSIPPEVEILEDNKRLFKRQDAIRM